MKKLIIDVAKKFSYFRRLLRFIYRTFNKIKYSFYKIRYKMSDKTIFFEVFDGKNYACSPKALYERMLNMKEFKDYKFIWAFKDIDKHSIKNDKRTIIVKSKSKEYYKYLSISKHWIVNFALADYITKKKNQIYVQCWHGTPLKRLRYDIEVNGAVMNNIKDIRRKNDIDAKRYDYFISPSKFSTEKFISAFNLKKLNKEDIIIEKGYPRNDSLFNQNKEDINSIKEKLGLPKNKKIILYPPTFRDNQHSSGVGYTYKIELDFDSLRDKFSNEYIVLFRPHYFVANSFNFDKYKGFVYDVSTYDDINDLYLISDILITDYSSVFFDFANLHKPIIFYMYDLDDYKNNLRDFYIPLNELPGPITKTQKELEKTIKDIYNISETYKNEYHVFNKKYNYLDDKNSSLRVIKTIFKGVFK